jgi:hypothetical protein
MRHSEADRKAFNIYEAKKAYAAKIAAWLAANPEIGELNSGKFYKYIGNEIVEVEALS